MFKTDEWVVLDLEVYPNYNCIGVKTEDGRLSYMLENIHTNFQHRKILKELLAKCKIITYNGVSYDMPVLACIVAGMNPKQVFNFSSTLIKGDMDGKKVQYWVLLKQHKIKQLYPKHYDLMKVGNTSNVSLKLLATRLHSEKLEELPYEPTKELTPEEWEKVKSYCENDLDVTLDLFKVLKSACELRDEISEEYGVNMSSLGDSRIAEKIIVSKMGHINAPNSPKPNIRWGFNYTPPVKMDFKTPIMQELYNDVTNHTFKISPTEYTKGNIKLVIPPFLIKPFVINETLYKFGLGGLHSKDKAISIIGKIYNMDVASYYPQNLINHKFYPKHFGDVFLKVYGSIFDERQQAKKDEKMYGKRLKELEKGTFAEREMTTLYNKAKTTNTVFKLVLNSTFGNTGSQYSQFYDLKVMLNITITGQLLLLLLAERLELANIRVISANTDGLEYVTDDWDKAKMIAKQWEKETNLVLEHETYHGLFARDVNNYFAVYDGYEKTKGVFSKPSIGKNVKVPICYKAIMDLIVRKIPITQTINECQDVRQFLIGTTVRGGAMWRGKHIGKVVRFYYTKLALDYLVAKNRADNAPRGFKGKWKLEAEDVGEPFYRVTKNKSGGHNKVSDSSGGYPLMNLPAHNKVPNNLCKEYYVELSYTYMGALGLKIERD